VWQCINAAQLPTSVKNAGTSKGKRTSHVDGCFAGRINVATENTFKHPSDPKKIPAHRLPARVRRDQAMIRALREVVFISNVRTQSMPEEQARESQN